ncbi:unnamed protein product [Cyclocybe aegerita]|uniref:Uncharacterized protein n=1 Tax=Cyclocybe aegerita TaxID=1973307 RepID=A0A8S0VYJ5_CYCAE|nr:unnamed protein product [Cyclocybe aegerita]
MICFCSTFVCVELSQTQRSILQASSFDGEQLPLSIVILMKMKMRFHRYPAAPQLESLMSALHAAQGLCREIKLDPKKAILLHLSTVYPHSMQTLSALALLILLHGLFKPNFNIAREPRAHKPSLDLPEHDRLSRS